MARKITVSVDETGIDGFFRRAREHVRALDRREFLKEETVICFEDPADMMRMLTTERMRLLSSLKREGSALITSLALRLGRNKRSVSRDVLALREHGLLATHYVTNAGHGRNLMVSPAAKRVELKATI